MKYKKQCECMDKNCKTVILGSECRLDGINCPRCGGSVIVKPFEPKKKPISDKVWFVREKIIERNQEHCFDLTPQQVETVLSIGDEYTD